MNFNFLSKYKKIFFVLGGLVLLLAVFGGGIYLGYNKRPAIEKITGVSNMETMKPEGVDFSSFWTAWSVVNSKFVSKDKIDSQKLVWGAIEGMVNSLDDPYTTFFPPKESKMFLEDVSGNFEGVGMEINIKKGVLTVVAPLKNTPAERAGLRAGDKILKIGDKITDGLTSDEAAQFIRGTRGTEVVLTVMRDSFDKPKEFKIIRDIIIIPTLDTEIKGDVFIIELYNFSANSVEAFRGALRSFIESGKTKLIIDLRNNPGGYLEASIQMASYFLPSGKIVVKEKFGDGKEDVFRSYGYDAFNDNLKMVVIINGGSASASEILAGALQENKKAVLVGEKSFGKGSVQEMVPITGDTSLKVTIAKWLTPNGRSISDEGLEPDYKVELTEKDAEKGVDPQLNKALEVLTK